MRITIIAEDKAVYKDGECLEGLNIPMVPSDIHALQWNGTTGVIEYVADENGVRKQNEKIIELPDWVISAVTVWDTKQLELQEEAARVQEEKEREKQEYEARAALEEAAIAATMQEQQAT